MIACRGHLSGFDDAYISMVFASIHLCFKPPLLVFKPMSSMYRRNISPSGLAMNLNWEAKGMTCKALCSFPAHKANPLPTLNIAVFKSWSGLLVPRRPRDHKRSSSIDVITSDFFMVKPIS